MSAPQGAERSAPRCPQRNPADGCTAASHVLFLASGQWPLALETAILTLRACVRRRYFASIMDALVRKARAEGSYDAGIRTLRPGSVTLAHSEVVHTDAVTGARAARAPLPLRHPRMYRTHAGARALSALPEAYLAPRGRVGGGGGAALCIHQWQSRLPFGYVH